MAQLQSLSIGGNTVADFIVEQGTETGTITGTQYSSTNPNGEAISGTVTWYWEKWNSGIVKCYGELTITDTTTAEQVNSITANLPSGLFISRLRPICSMSDWTIDNVYENPVTTDTLSQLRLAYWARKAATNIEHKFTVMIYGKWK